MEISMKEYNLKSFKSKDLWSWEEIIGKIEDLESENDSLKEKIEDIKEDIKSNFKHMTVAEQVDIDDKDFLDEDFLK